MWDKDHRVLTVSIDPWEILRKSISEFLEMDRILKEMNQKDWFNLFNYNPMDYTRRASQYTLLAECNWYNTMLLKGTDLLPYPTPLQHKLIDHIQRKNFIKHQPRQSSKRYYIPSCLN